MKFFKTILLLITGALFFQCCQRELFFDGISAGKLKKDATGNCLPVKVSGVYNIDSAFSDKNFIEAEVEVSFAGTYEITSDTINGFYFHQTGKVDKGTSTIHLMASGKPIAQGNNCFTIRYGSSTCNVCVKTFGPQPAQYTLAGAPGICTGIFADGSYVIGKPLSPSNILKVQAVVNVPGNYTITATTTNGFSFSGSGVFTTTGLQDVYLKGTGTPVKAEVSIVEVNGVASKCNTGITVLSDTAGKAVFSFEGAPNDCINFTIDGNYYVGIATTTANTVTMHVNVSKPGSYAINTNTANGITFSDAGSFTTTGQHTVVLLAKGTPVRAESTAFVPNTGTVTCNFYLTVAPLPPPAAFTLSGAPGACAPVTVNGFYILSKPLDGANTVVIQADVGSTGSYTIATNTVNGMSFTASGVFSSTGLQNVLLRGSGVPGSTGTYTLTPRVGTSACNFSILVIQ
ncbi:hypothetical protein [Ferruginibacter profundus]